MLFLQLRSEVPGRFNILSLILIANEEDRKSTTRYGLLRGKNALVNETRRDHSALCYTVLLYRYIIKVCPITGCKLRDFHHSERGKADIFKGGIQNDK